MMTLSGSSLIEVVGITAAISAVAQVEDARDGQVVLVLEAVLTLASRRR